MISLSEYLKGGETVISNLFLRYYTRLGLTTVEFMLWLQLYSAGQSGDAFPDLTKIAATMGLSIEKVYELLNNLINKKFLKLESALDDKGRRMDQYNLSLAFERLAIIKEQEKFQEEEAHESESRKSMLQTFEQEFGRPLSPIEYQKIGYWLDEDHYAPALITLALQEAVLNQAYNFKYIETVLQSWEKKNIRTKQQVEEEQRRRKQLIVQKEETAQAEELPKVSLYNWLDEERSSDVK